MQAIFIGILLLLYIVHYSGMSWLFKKRQNKNDDFIGKNAPNEIQQFFGRAMYLIWGYYLIVFVYALTGFTFWKLISEISFLSEQKIQIGGFVLSIIFLILMTMARLNLGSSWRVGLDYESTDALITHGFYSRIRNPYFTFMLAFQAALIFVSPNALMIFAFIQSRILLGLQARHEEVFLLEKYGDEYSVYKNQTGRFFPKSLKK